MFKINILPVKQATFHSWKLTFTPKPNNNSSLANIHAAVSAAYILFLMLIHAAHVDRKPRNRCATPLPAALSRDYADLSLSLSFSLLFLSLPLTLTYSRKRWRSKYTRGYTRCTRTEQRARSRGGVGMSRLLCVWK